jgi:hypothetical protein
MHNPYLLLLFFVIIIVHGIFVVVIIVVIIAGRIFIRLSGSATSSAVIILIIIVARHDIIIVLIIVVVTCPGCIIIVLVLPFVFGIVPNIVLEITNNRKYHDGVSLRRVPLTSVIPGTLDTRTSSSSFAASPPAYKSRKTTTRSPVR